MVKLNLNSDALRPPKTAKNSEYHTEATGVVTKKRHKCGEKNLNCLQAMGEWLFISLDTSHVGNFIWNLRERG